MPLADLLRTKIHLTAMEGRVTENELGYALQTPLAPTFFHGNCVVLRDEPLGASGLRERFLEDYGPDARHALFVWGGGAPDEALLREARSLGFVHERDSSMVLNAPPAEDARWTVRPLRLDEFPAVKALDAAADGADRADGDPSYIAFKRQVRALNLAWIESGKATWWGAFDGDQLAGQCGFVHCDSEIGGGLGRFQSVAVHPQHRLKGVASSLVATVARDGFRRFGCRRVILEADPHGPAASLYERIGFQKSGDVHSLTWSASETAIRAETAADEAGVLTLVEAAFGQPDEATIVRRLRAEEGVYSFVAGRNGALLGHSLFSPARIEASDGSIVHSVALGPLAVRPEVQRSGVGAALVREGLARLKSAGHGLCFVLGSPAYYSRFGFEPASGYGWTCEWPEAGDAFQCVVLDASSERPPPGLVRYHAAFKDVSS